MNILVVILNYRTPQLTINGLRSLISEVQSLSNIQVVVVDNCSGDGSAEQIQAAIQAEGWGEWASVLALNQNGGYAFGNNAAIRPALQSSHPPDFVWLLNPDTEVRPGAMQPLIDFLQTHPQAGIVGSRLEYPDRTPQRSAFRFQTLMSQFEGGLRLGLVSKLLARWMVAPPVSNSPCATDWVPGASMMVRREVFEQAGLLDEGYFLYYEDEDFCLQAKRAGWSCWYEPQSRVVHLVGQSSGITDTKITPKRRPQYWFDARRRYYVKNYGWLYAALVDGAWIMSLTLWRWRRTLERKPILDPPSFLGDSIRNSVFLSLFQQTRRS
ncbi:glycosyltransferase family 2 protein [Lyngbya sp. PCC 8106]|uniref:glycosyltransferase family 2 protein n=1 Tax=Lyngbya sp. (strain PCC 8106) TaxID=313612 RepID=UPI0000EAA1F5|nr:glycosyltransferase family 2 protein [Lyngbya sp. PCC 8106]EAW37837.1 glycosyl transferase, group 2 family protein [Lyngbya sp. PCC 8106]